MNERWTLIKELFDETADLDPVSRDRLLADRTIDPETRGELSALLSAHDHQTLLEEGPAEPAPERVGPFVLRERIGRGGFGDVFRAEQTAPVVREVAVKLLHPTQHARTVFARFALEQQALARLDHPCIARLFEAGVTPGGRPWFAMQLVRGERIDEYARTARAPARVLIELIERASRAVHHAHQRAVLHRDIKPSNILVELPDGEPSPKLIDFGVAKALDQPAADHGLTHERVQVGTPAFMSPEQRTGEPVDVRTDVYSLAAVLYDLLSSSASGYAEKTPPSSRDAPLASAKQWGTDARTIRALDPVLRRALATSPSDRYDSALAFADDLAAVQSGEPTTAGEPSVLQRSLWFARRHRFATASVTLAVATLLGTAVGASYGLLKVRHQRDAATAAAKEADRQRQNAEAIARLTGEILTGIDPDIARGRDTSLLLERTEHALTQLDEGVMAGQPEAEASLRAVIGQALLNLGRTDRALAVVQRGLEIAVPALGRDHIAVRELSIARLSCMVDAGMVDRAVEAAKSDIEARRRASGDQTAPLGQRELLLGASEQQTWATVFLAAGDVESAAQWNRSALLTVAMLDPPDLDAYARALMLSAQIASAEGDSARAVASAERALDVVKKRVASPHPALARAHNDLGAFLEEAGRPSEAIGHKLAALEIARAIFPGNDARTAAVLDNIAVTMQGLGRADEAGRYLDESLAMFRAVYPADHPDLARVIAHASVRRAIDGDFEAAESLARESLTMRQRLYPGAASEPVASGLASLARIIAASGRLEAAEPYFIEALRMRRSLARGTDTPDVAVSAFTYGEALHRAGREQDAEPLLREAVEIGNRLRGTEAGQQAGLVEWTEVLAKCLQRQGKESQADVLLKSLRPATDAPGTSR